MLLLLLETGARVAEACYIVLNNCLVRNTTYTYCKQTHPWYAEVPSSYTKTKKHNYKWFFDASWQHVAKLCARLNLELTVE